MLSPLVVLSFIYLDVLDVLVQAAVMGIPTDSWMGVVFTDPICHAEPLNTPLHPTQLYSVGMLLIILAVLFFIKSRKKFDGQLFPIYLMLYSIGRSIIEEYRGDEARGFLMDGWLSHSQFISLFIFAGAAFLYYRFSKLGTTTAASTGSGESESQKT